jgi:hypothetical protein
MSYQYFLDCAEQQRKFADLVLCDEARSDYLMWAEYYEWRAEFCRTRVDYDAITRDIAYLNF